MGRHRAYRRRVFRLPAGRPVLLVVGRIGRAPGAGQLGLSGDLTLAVHGATDLGRIFFFAEFATAVVGWVLGINPFD